MTPDMDVGNRRRIEERDAAVVTGASHGIGRAISERLLTMGYEVYGFGRDFSDWGMQEHFHPVACDLLDTDAVLRYLQPIRKTGRVRVLVNNAGTAYYGLHEELSPKKIQEMVRLNLELPMVLTQYFLRELKKCQGDILQISSVTATHPAPHGAVYGATKAGLLSFSRSLFEEARKYGVRVTSILPDMTDSELYRHADFTVGEALDTHLRPEEVADAVEFVLTRRSGMEISEIMLRPQRNQIRRK